LTPLLEADDAPNVSSLLVPSHWPDDEFYTHVLWIAKIPDKVLTSQIRDQLIAVAVKHPNLMVREWAVEALCRFTDPEAGQGLRQAEERGSPSALRVLCEHDADPGGAFLRRFTHSNPAVRDAAYRLVEEGFFEHKTVSGGLDPERRAVILKHLLAEWPGADSPPERIETTVRRLYVLVADGQFSQPARWNPEAAAAVVRQAEQVLTAERGQRHAPFLLTALRWAHTPEARKVVEQLAKQGKEAGIREVAEDLLHKW
jgi:hypothetical protein